ncbi:rhomboid family intramembrane serine protease [Derxia gummosa]|uniref:Rhomboid family intramembrane serine protease n=1 Tax=Derxia gummosa DSM 723 TaxID=1121388 RepID=A0A8B6XAC8_9BURK|nr:rhomboid family intramembrane serine protease [Derxia gummosa]
MLLVFPLEHKPDWRRPPVMTLLLILLNCLIWFGPQRADEKAEEKAAQHYFESGLAAIELPRYAAWVERQNDAEHRELARQLARTDPDKLARAVPLLGRLETDMRFRAELDAGRIVRADEDIAPQWRELRERYAKLRGGEFTLRWSQRPADWRVETLLSATFLHGSTMHLVGNMVFLFMFGYTLEMTLGAPLFLLCYLLAGVGGEVGDLLARWGSQVPGLGASGAVSGLMAMYVVLHGWRRIRFFFHLLFYFSVIRAPAIILLPVWMGFELYAHFAESHSGIANMAHFGGLLTGALLMFGLRRLRPAMQAPVAPEAVPDPFELKRAEAKRLLAAARYDEARGLLDTLSAERPRDVDAVMSFFNLARLRPDTPQFHVAAMRAFNLPDDRLDADALLRACRDYLEWARPRPMLRPEAALKLALRVARHGDIALARKLTALASPGGGAPAGVAAVRLAIIATLLRTGNRAEAATEAGDLAREHPGSAEARMAADMLKGA